jgi:NADH-quinone oxidoreductase subunit G
VAGDPFVEMLERGALQQVGIYEQQPFESYFSGNTVQICPVGALTGAQYRFRARPFDLVSTPTACEHCASGCALRTDHRRGKVLRRLANDDPQVNEEWNCDKGRWAFQYAQTGDRIAHPMVREPDGTLVPTSWPDALATAAAGLAAARGESGVGVLVGGRVTVEDAYAYAKFARLALGTNDVDFRARPHSGEEAEFLASVVAGRTPETGAVTYEELEDAAAVLLVGFEPEEESPIVFLRLRKAVRKSGQRVFAVAPYATRGLEKLSGGLLPAAPGTEAEVLDALGSEGTARDLGDVGPEAARLLGSGPAVVLAGERLATVPGALTAVLRLAEATGARVAWVPRRAGERGALDAGALPTLLPGGRLVADPSARVDVAAVWGVESLPRAEGRDTAAIVETAAAGRLGLVVGGVEPDDLPDPQAALAALQATPFLVSLEIRESAVTAYADVVLPVAPVVEKAGSFLDWEGRQRAFDAVLRDTGSLSDARVLDALAAAMGLRLGVADVAAVRSELAELHGWEGEPAPRPSATAGDLPRPQAGEAVLATWRHLLDRGRLQDGEPFLAGTAKRPVARVSAATAEEAGIPPGGSVTVRGRTGEVTLPVAITEMPDRVVWLPTNSAGCDVRLIGVQPGGVVSLSAVSPSAGSPGQPVSTWGAAAMSSSDGSPS